MSTHISELYKQVYKRLDDVTPLTVDCGELCDKLCCRGDEESGMYLFPGKSVCLSKTRIILFCRPILLQTVDRYSLLCVTVRAPARTDRLPAEYFPSFRIIRGMKAYALP